jgi:tagatose-1,6-bisphosphate aldolase
MVIREAVKRTLSVGKMRGLQQCSTSYGAFAVLALDHRNNLRAALRPDAPETVSRDDMIAFKREVIAALAPASSSVLLDPEIGAAQCITGGAIPGATGLVVALEATGYTGTPSARQSEILPGWSVAKAQRMGASAVKLLVYYHPDAPTASAIETLVEQTAQECRANDLALILEPLSYAHGTDAKTLSASERYRVVIETARRLTIPGVDILKAEFPLAMDSTPGDQEMADACRDLSAASAVPWILLSASVPFETYLRQVTIACQAGASGVAAGRAVWKEAAGLQGEARGLFLRKTAYARLERLTDLCDALARPWMDFYTPVTIGENWYEYY